MAGSKKRSSGKKGSGKKRSSGKKYQKKIMCVRCAHKAKPLHSGNGKNLTTAQREKMRKAGRTENDGPVKEIMIKGKGGSKRRCQVAKCAKCGGKKYRFIKM